MRSKKVIKFLVDSTPIEDECCYKKKVGQYDYILVKNSEQDTKEYGCHNNCVYKKLNDSKSIYYCFKKGSLPVECLAKREPDDELYWKH